MREDLEGTIRRIAAFIDIALDDELLAITLEHASFDFMNRHKDRFDDAMLRALSEESILPPGSDSAKVRAGKVGATTLGDQVIAALDQAWQEHVTPITGFASYEALIATLR